jgi:serine/threonine protein kinase
MASEQGKHFGRYELQTRIGRGGMAETWRARLMGAAGVTKSVLIKKVLPEFAGDAAFINMFISEARISATLSHGNVAQVFDFGQVDGNYFLAMEYVDGQPLHRILKRAKGSGFTCLPGPIATFIALEMCRGLHYAHTRTDEKGVPLGIVHRDISPDNVLVSYEGQVKIVDFGIAKARSLRGFDTAPGVVKGKYLFFSPEQARGEQVDARTDVWATGVVLYLMVCGRLPLEGPEYEVRRKLALRQPLPRARDVLPDVPAALDAILHKALALKKEDRFESAHALGDALAGFLYTSAPRFSAMSAAYLLCELFRTEMTQEGRDTRVPPTFVEELSVWRAAPPLPRPTEPGRPPLSEEPRTQETDRLSLPPPRAPEEKAKEEEGDSESGGGLFQDGIGVSTAIAGVAVLVVLALLWVAFTRVRDDWMAQEAPSRPQPPPGFQPVPPPTRTAEATAPKGASADPDVPSLASWPVDAFQLDARRHVFKVSSGLAALGALSPETDWRLVETTVLTSVNRADAMPTLFYFLTGPGVDAARAVGTVSRKPETLRGASGLMLFTLGPPTSENLPERFVSATSARTEEPQRFTVHPEWMTATPDRAFLLTGLLPEETYRLTLEPVGEGAFIRGAERGSVHTVACLQREREEDLAPERVSRFLLSQGEEVRITGMRGLACGFIDDDPADNAGAMRVLIEKSRPLADRGTPVVRQASAPSRSSPARQEKRTEAAPEPAASEGSAADVLASARALFKAGKLEAARTRARQCVAAAPQDAECYLLLGSVEARLGRREEGAKNYRRFLELAPGDHPQASQVLRMLQEYEAR